MAFKPLGYYCNSTFPLIEELESEYGSHLQKMSYELKLATRSAFASLIMLLELSDRDLTVRQLAQEARAFISPYVSIEEYQVLADVMDRAIHLDVGDMEAFLHGLTSIIQEGEG